MGLCKKILTISFKEKTVFRFDYVLSTVFSFLYIILKVFLWKGLYGEGGENVNGIFLNDMIVYSILASFTEGITKTDVMTELNSHVLDGSISMNLLLPIGFKKYLFLNSLTRNLFQTVYKIVPSVLVAMLIFGLNTEFHLSSVLFYIVSVFLGILISFLYHFLFGLSVIRFRNSFFLDNINYVLVNIFSGAAVPIWFFPEGLGSVSFFLPFRYIVFEPITILLNKKSPEEIFLVLGIQALWVFLLFLGCTAVWSKGRRKLMIQGG